MRHLHRLVLSAMLAASAALSFAPAMGQQPGAAPAAAAAPAELPASIAKRDPAAIAAWQASVQLLGEKKLNEAIVEANKALAIDPTFPEPHVVKGEALKAKEDFQGAVTAFTDAMTFDQNSVAAYNGRGEALMELIPLGQAPDLAMNDFRKANQLDPNDARVLSNMGHMFITYLGDPNGAIRVLTEAVAANPSDARAFRDKGQAHAMLREIDEAIASLAKAVEVAPDDYENYQMQAVIFQLQEDYAASIEPLSKAIETYKPKKRTDEKQYLDGYMMRADAYLRVGENETDPEKRKAAIEASIADSDAILAIYPDRYPVSGIALYRRGRALRMLDRYADAIDSLTRSILLIPADQEAGYVAEAYMFRGVCWYYQKSNDLARGDFERASAIGSGYQDPRVPLWIGFTHHAEGDHRQAIESYNEAIAKNPDFALAYVNRGRAYYDLKEYGKAIESFNSAIGIEPGNAEHYYKTGIAALKMEDLEKAEFFLELALHQDNATPKMYRAMAKTLRALGRGELADEYERQAENPPKKETGG